MTRVVVVSPVPLGGEVAGTGIRALELARVLAAHADVELAAAGAPPATVAGLPAWGYEPQQPRALAEHGRGADVVVALPQWPPGLRALRATGARLLFDLYVPEPLETLGGFPGDRPRVRRALVALAVDRVTAALRAGERFVCASEGQRDLWLGVMLAERLIDHARYAADPSLRDLIDVVPFGVPAAAATATGRGGARAAFPGALGPDAEIVLWNGGVWPWLDPLGAVRAIARVREQRPGVRLVFMGAAPQLPARRTLAEVRELAGALGLLGSTVLVHDGWVPYEQRADWLLEAACAISAHHDQLETRFAFRTRLLDCFWARLPIVCTGGDDLGELVAREGLGATAPPGDDEALAAGLLAVLERGRAAYEPRLAAVAERFVWPRVAAPLVRHVLAAPLPRARSPRRPGQAARHAGYLAARTVLDAAGLRDWPRL